MKCLSVKRTICLCLLFFLLIFFYTDAVSRAQNPAGTIAADSICSKNLENSGVKHFAEEYIGTHVGGIYTKKGRIPDQMLPFFDSYPEFGE